MTVYCDATSCRSYNIRGCLRKTTRLIATKDERGDDVVICMHRNSEERRKEERRNS